MTKRPVDTFSANAQLASALASRDEAQLRAALKAGANPNLTLPFTRTTLMGRPAGLTPVEFALQQMLPMSYVQMLVKFGASLGSTSQPLDPLSPLGFAVRMGHNVAIMKLLEMGAVPGEAEWREVFRRNNPSQLARFFRNHPPTTATLEAMVIEHATALGLQNNGEFYQQLGMDWARALRHPKVWKLIETAPGSMEGERQAKVYLQVLDLALKKDPLALEKTCKAAGKTPLHTAFGRSLASIIKHPAIAPLIERPDRQRRTPLQRHLQQRMLTEAVDALLNAGAKMPARLEGETRSDYWGRVAPKLAAKPVGSFNHFAEKAWTKMGQEELEQSCSGGGARRLRM